MDAFTGDIMLRYEAIMRSSHVRLIIMTLALLLAGCSAKKSSIPLTSISGKQNEVQCYQMFTALKSLDNASFKKYQQQFSVINNNYAIYKKNQSLIDGNSSEIFKLVCVAPCLPICQGVQMNWINYEKIIICCCNNVGCDFLRYG